ncbi:MAG TPA: hypothetical protein VKF79_01485 [Candidatus Acidoferrum sp.]|nr:hypothetical protein [Candidatus Acidoferrum sp.]
MNIQSNSRIAAAAIMGWLFTLYVQHDYAKWRIAGRDAFLSYQANRYDTKMFGPHASSVIAFIVLAVIIFGVYEVAAAVVYKILAATLAPKAQATPNLPPS